MSTNRISTNKVLRMGFGIVIVLMVVLAAVALRQVQKVNARIVNLVEVVNKKTEFASNMREAIRLRRIMLNKMVASNDVFERDEDLMRFYGLAGEYRKNRENLVSLPMNEQEEILHETLSATTKISQSITRRVLDRIAVGENYQAIESDLAFAIEEQANVLDLLNELVALQKKISEMSVKNARLEYITTIKQIISIGVLIVLISTFIMIVVTRYVSRQNNALMEASKSKTDFLASMSHEIRTPLTAVIGFGETLADNPSDPNIRMQASQSVVKAGKHLLSIVNDILDISKIEADKIELEKREFSLFDLVDEVSMLMAVQAKNKGLRFDVVYHFPLPEILITDPLRLKQILINLCGNAVKFTQYGSVVLEIKHDITHGLLNFEVWDSGVGMTEQQLAKLFRPFVQADSITTRKFGGTGLGLYLSRQLSQKLGGDIRVKSTPGKGSEFTLYINVSGEGCKNIVNKLPEKPVQPAASETRIQMTGRVLVAEDTVDNQKLLEYFIRKLGAQCKIVENGREAVVSAINERFDLILMDWQMPEMNGLQAVTELRQRGYQGAIVALTANVMSEDKEKCLNAGCDEFLAKPINKVEFIKVLSRYLIQPAEHNEFGVRSTEFSPKFASSSN